jgi:hypothetical protein
VIVKIELVWGFHLGSAKGPQKHMPRDGAITFSDLIGKLDALRVS